MTDETPEQARVRREAAFTRTPEAYCLDCEETVVADEHDLCTECEEETVPQVGWDYFRELQIAASALVRAEARVAELEALLHNFARENYGLMLMLQEQVGEVSAQALRATAESKVRAVLTPKEPTDAD